MGRKKKQPLTSSDTTLASYEGLCSRFTDLMGMKSVMPSAAWERHVLGSVMTILQYQCPEVLKQVRQVVKEYYGQPVKGIPEHVSEEGQTIRCPTCSQPWEPPKKKKGKR